MINPKAPLLKTLLTKTRTPLLGTTLIGLLTAGQMLQAAEEESTAATEQAPAPTAAASTKGNRILPDPDQQKLAALAKARLPDTEVLWLETQKESFLGLQQQAISGEALGGVLILHHDRTSPDWPELVQGLRSGLPRQGWHSLAIAVPNLPQATIPKRVDDTASAAAASTPEIDLKPVTDQLIERIESGLNQLQSLGAKRFVLMGIGTGGYWAAKYAESAGTQRPLHLTLINAQQPSIDPKADLAALAATLKIPTLDLFHGSGVRTSSTLFSKVEQGAQQRLNQARREQRQYYIQRRLPPAASLSSVTDKRLLSTFKGLFEKHLMGIQPTTGGAAGGKEAMPGK
ncbi:MAG: alpha/beta hydrolase family protein [Motiliproteus sp.]|nr:alpha/beta hydrolase family protein [Motiliproteus sp.]MCW9053081.1 alpha/beta hydrolase family protein [Motiliproteus sp.]